MFILQITKDKETSASFRASKCASEEDIQVPFYLHYEEKRALVLFSKFFVVCCSCCRRGHAR